MPAGNVAGQPVTSGVNIQIICEKAVLWQFLATGHY